MAKEFLFNTCTALGLHHAFHSITKKKILIVMYHGVIDEPLPLPCWWQLPYEKFYWQIKYLKKNYTILPIQEIILKIQKGEELPDNTAAITFDDGFANNHTLAYPLLKALDVPATIYVVTDYIGTKNLLWLDELFMIFLETLQKEIDLRNFGLRLFSLRTVQNKQCSLLTICDHLKTISPEQKNEILNFIRLELSKKSEPSEYSKHFKLLTWEEIHEIEQNSRINFGAHTCTHEILSQLNDIQLAHEIKTSCQKMKATAPLLFAYPNGRPQDYDNRTKIILKNLNVLCAVSTISGLNSIDTNPFDLKRISVGEDTTSSRFKLLCSGFIDAMKMAP